MPPEIRLQKFMAECGVASRRKAEELILSGRVSVNGQLVTKLGTRIDPSTDKIEVNGKLLKQKEEKIYLKLNKPPGYVSSCRKFKEEKTILDLVRGIPYRLYPVGRLDKDSEGLIILTNDGELAYRLMHPRYEHEKEYEVEARDPLTHAQIERLKKGAARVSRLGGKSIRIVLKEGKKRQIREMMKAVGNRAIRLKRVRIKNIRLGDLAGGKHALLTTTEIRGLMV